MSKIGDLLRRDSKRGTHTLVLDWSHKVHEEDPIQRDCCPGVNRTGVLPKSSSPEAYGRPLAVFG